MASSRAARRANWWINVVALAGLTGLPLPGCHRSTGRNAPQIAINEVMAGVATRPLEAPDGSPIVDGEGMPADWIEVYNPLPAPVSLRGFTLTDDRGRPGRYRFPAMVLQPGEFVLVVADNRPEAGPFHAGFRLGGGGEEIFLFALDGAALVDRIVFRSMADNASAGRFPDGAREGENYGVIYAPSPGRANGQIDVRPPQNDGPVGAQPIPEDPDRLRIVFEVVQAPGLKIHDASIERTRISNCGNPPSVEEPLPGKIGAVETGRFPRPAEVRIDVYGAPQSYPRESVAFEAFIPKEEPGTILRLKIRVENEVGAAERIDAQFFGCAKPTIAINEFQPDNDHTITFDRYNAGNDTPVETGDTPDWIELYNYGDQPIEIGGFALIGAGTFDDLAQNPPPFIWRFGDVGIRTIEPRQYLLILAAEKDPYRMDQGQLVLDEQGKPIPDVETYARSGEADRRYRSTNFRIDRGGSSCTSTGDAFYLLAPSLVVIDSAHFNFNDQPGCVIAPDQSFGRFPDGADPETALRHRDRVDTGGKFLDFATPEKSNVVQGDVAPFFSPIAFTEPRCPVAGTAPLITAFVNIDADTASQDRPDEPGKASFEAEVHYAVDGQEQPVLRRGEGLDVAVATESDVRVFNPTTLPGTVLYRLRARLPVQPARALVTYGLRVRDILLPAGGPGAGDGGWMSLNESTPGSELVSFRYKPGYEPPPLAINEVFPSSTAAGSRLPYPGPHGPDLPPMDYAEIFNDSGEEQDLSGMFLHDEGLLESPLLQGKVREFEFPQGARIGPHGFLCVFFPRPGEEGNVPADAISVTGMGLDDCAEVLYLIAPDRDGNCRVASARWDLLEGGGNCPADVAVGRVPDSDIGSQSLARLVFGPSPCASNCGGRAPEFIQPPIHFAFSTNPTTPMVCPEPTEVVLIRAEVLVDVFAGAVGCPGQGQGPPTGVCSAKLILTRGDRETERAVSLSPIAGAPDPCWTRLRLNETIRPPHPPVTFYRLVLEDALGRKLESDRFSFGTTEVQRPPVAINELMAINKSTLADEDGLFGKPWVEIRSGGDQAVDLAGMFLTDNLSSPQKWKFPSRPETLLAPRGCLIIFLDGDTADANDLHAGITIQPGSAGQLHLLDKIESGSCAINSFAHGPEGHQDDTSIGRVPPIAGEPVVLPAPSPCTPEDGRNFIRGDATENGRVTTTDMTVIFQFVNGQAAGPACQKAMDVNDDGRVTVDDGFHLGNFLVSGMPLIPPPFPLAGTDSTTDGLPCP